jgi:hypothetical protein
MKRRSLTLISSILALAVSGAWAASNLNSSKSNLNREYPNGRIVSATTTLSGPNDAQVAYTTSAKGDFILTQLCTSPVNGGVLLSASGFGGIAHTGSELCYTFTPGVSVPKDSQLVCSTTQHAEPGPHFCTISGVKSP